MPQNQMYPGNGEQSEQGLLGGGLLEAANPIPHPPPMEGWKEMGVPGLQDRWTGSEAKVPGEAGQTKTRGGEGRKNR